MSMNGLHPCGLRHVALTGLGNPSVIRCLLLGGIKSDGKILPKNLANSDHSNSNMTSSGQWSACRETSGSGNTSSQNTGNGANDSCVMDGQREPLPVGLETWRSRPVNFGECPARQTFPRRMMASSNMSNMTPYRPAIADQGVPFTATSLTTEPPIPTPGAGGVVEHSPNTKDSPRSGQLPLETAADNGFKRRRTTYTSVQILEMEKEFQSSNYLCRKRQVEIAERLQVKENQIKIWFQNRRMKFKKMQRTRLNNSVITTTTTTPTNLVDAMMSSPLSKNVSTTTLTCGRSWLSSVGMHPTPPPSDGDHIEQRYLSNIPDTNQNSQKGELKYKWSPGASFDNFITKPSADMEYAMMSPPYSNSASMSPSCSESRSSSVDMQPTPLPYNYTGHLIERRCPPYVPGINQNSQKGDVKYEWSPGASLNNSTYIAKSPADMEYAMMSPPYSNSVSMSPSCSESRSSSFDLQPTSPPFNFLSHLSYGSGINISPHCEVEGDWPLSDFLSSLDKPVPELTSCRYSDTRQLTGKPTEPAVGFNSNPVSDVADSNVFGEGGFSQSLDDVDFENMFPLLF